ncbi:MAG TPA: hypothetical protein VEJ63_02085 [Planctomycetota bacterium]|nr:hypothetical protein [Planctomycetota bacterium]
MRYCGLILSALLLCFSAYADLQTDARVDKVVLKDGTEIECVVIMITKRGALIVEQDPKDKEQTRERIIPADEIERIDHGEADGSKPNLGFQTDKELAHKVIKGSGFRRTEKKKDKKDEEAEKKPVTNQQLVMGKAKTITTDPLAAATGKMSAQDLSSAYLSRFPVLKSTAQTLIGTDRLPQLIDAAQKGDPLARKQVEGFLKLFLGGDNSTLNEKPQATAPQKPVKPAKPERPQRQPAPRQPAAK